MNRLFASKLLLICCLTLVVASCSGEEAPVEPLEAEASITGTQKIPGETPTLEEPDGSVDLLYAGTDDMPWWNDTVFYEVFVRSFYDSDDDGVGDINGLIEKLDYLNDGDPTTSDDLGVTGLWLMPVTQSPSYHGYDVVDYFAVDEEYGTEEDLKRLIEEAHARGIRVVVDLVLNHTSSQHPWFEASQESDSDQRDWYIWSDDNPNYRGPWGQTVWHPDGGDYYYGVFWDGMPDLNLENPEVTQAMYGAAQFWLEDIGVDGFRLDAIKHLVEDDQLQENTPASHEWLGEFYDFYKDVNPDAFTVGEAWTSTLQVLDYTGDEVDIAFQFDLAEDIFNTASVGVGSLYADELTPIVEEFPQNQYATFITNHDQNRVMSQLKGDTAAAKVAASLLLTGPGVPFVYYGEEIGMMGTKPDEDIRRPMQWSGEGDGAGFTEGTPWRAPFEDYQERNVEGQDADPDSLLSHYRQLIQLRNDHEALRIGDWTLIETRPGRLYAFLRQSDDEALMVLINPNKQTIDDYSLDLGESSLGQDLTVELLFGKGEVSAPIINASGGFSDYRPFDSLPAQSTFVIELSQ